MRSREISEGFMSLRSFCKHASGTACFLSLRRVLFGCACGVMLLLIGIFAVVRLFGISPYVVTSGSMEPRLPVGSVVFVDDIAPENVRVGDAITFIFNEGPYVTHEVYEIDGDSRLFYTEGIANTDPQGNVIHDAQPVPFASYVGTVVACVPFIGFARVLASPGVVVGIAMSIAALCCALRLARTHELLARGGKRAEPFGKENAQERDDASKEAC